MSLKPKPVDFNNTWANLKETVKGVITLSSGVSRAVWNDRFTDVYSLCVAYPEPLADRLYNETKAFLEDHVSNLLKQVKSGGHKQKLSSTGDGKVGSGGGGNLLKAFHEAWLEFSKGISYLDMLYSYLNQQHIKKQKVSEAELTYGSLSIDQNETIKEIGELGLDIWRKQMIEPLRDELVSLLLNGIKHDRLAETGSQRTDSSHYQADSTIKGVISSFVEVEGYKKKGGLELYEEMFEKPFLSATGEYYNAEASKLLQEGHISIYMEKVIQRIESENKRSRKFLYPSSFSKVTSECEQRMVGDHLGVLHAECRPMVDKEIHNDLANMYRLLKAIQGAQQVLLDQVQDHIKARGLDAVSGLKGDTVAQQFVENVLGVHKKYLEMIKNDFQADLTFYGALDKACSAVINHRAPRTPSKAPELLARYCDTLLKKSQKGISESEIDDRLSSSITVFKYLDDKDVFQKFYSRNLGKRLIHQQSHSMDLEEAMINRLKQACGYEFTNKFHRMFTDISLAEDLNNKFSDHLKTAGTDVGINYFVRVLQQGAWPLSQNNLSPLAIPVELEKVVTCYEEFYAKQFNGRKLTWLHHLSNGDVKLGYLPKAYIVNMTTFQMALLLMFEKTDSYKLDELEKATQIAKDQFIKNVQSLLESKLLVSNNEDICQESTVISLNTKYSNKRTKFRIAGAVQRETPQEVEQTHQAVDDDRKMYLQAAIVRVMKSRKQLKHNQLIQEVLSQSKARFAPSIPMIKKCIESLIEKAYIERSQQSADEYSYMA